MTLKQLRIMIVVLWLIYVAQILVFQIYDANLDSLILKKSIEILSNIVNSNNIFYGLFVIEIALFIYASATLWLAYLSGKRIFLLWVILTLINNFFIPIQAYTSIDNFLENVNYVVIGIILAALYLPPLNKIVHTKKPFKFLQVFFLFFLFFLIFFGVPIIARNIFQ